MRPSSSVKTKTSSKKSPEQPKAYAKHDDIFSYQKENATGDSTPRVFGKPLAASQNLVKAASQTTNSNIFSINELKKSSDSKPNSPEIKTRGKSQTGFRNIRSAQETRTPTQVSSNVLYYEPYIIRPNSQAGQKSNIFTKSPETMLLKALSQLTFADQIEKKFQANSQVDDLPAQNVLVQHSPSITVMTPTTATASRYDLTNSIRLFKLGDTTPEEKNLIAMFFRHRFNSFLRATEEKIKMNSILYRGSNNKRNENTSSGAYENLSSISYKPSNPHEALIIEDAWKNLKRLASTRSKYKVREVGNFEKKVLCTIKQLTVNLHPSIIDGNSQGKKGTKEPKIELTDEKNSPSKKWASIDSRSKREPSSYKLENTFRVKKAQNPYVKIFIVVGGYQDLKNALLARGWIENPNKDSNQFHLKWTLKKADLHFGSLQSNQYVNHFEKNTTITTKNGLSRNLRNLIWFQQEDIDTFYPRCFDLNDFSEFDDFIEDFKFSEAEKVLKTISLEGIAKRSNSQISVLKLLTALYVCERRLKDIDQLMNRIYKNIQDNVSLLEWEVLNSIDSQVLNNSRYQNLISHVQGRFAVSISDNEENLRKALEKRIADALNLLSQKFYQSRLNTGRNIWIIKPAGLSRGRGIACYDNLPAILNHIKFKDTEWVAQKYLENLLVVKNRKFDIRQWVLVTDWSPLTIWFYERCYIRFTADEYDPQNLSNKFAHLTNNAIAKHSSKFDDSEIEGNMWTDEDFANHLKQMAGKDVFRDLIKPIMRNSVIKSLVCAQDMVENRQNSFELFGYDFMVDDDFKPWLIEINSSPSMDYSTKITENLVKRVLEDVVKVIVDHQIMTRSSGKQVDTGYFRCIYRGNTI